MRVSGARGWPRSLSTRRDRRPSTRAPAGLLYRDGEGGVFQTTDGGGTWRPFGTGLTTLRVDELAIDSTGRVLYAATDGGGVFDYRFPDWTPMQAAHPRSGTRPRGRLLGSALLLAASLAGSRTGVCRRRRLGPVARPRGRRSARPCRGPPDADHRLRGHFPEGRLQEHRRGVAVGGPRTGVS